MSLVGKSRQGARSRPGRTGAVGRMAGRAGRFAAGVGAMRGRAGAGFRRHHRGISATELRGFRKVASLLRRVGMVPRGTRHKPVRR